MKSIGRGACASRRRKIARRRAAMAEALDRRLLLAAQLVKDINTIAAPSSIAKLTPAGDIAYFADNAGTTGSELWKTDGTAAGTVMVKDINPGGAGSNPSGFTTIGGITYFSADDGTDGTELWRTDGTGDGTWRVKDIDPGPAGSIPTEPTAVGSILYFFANDGAHGTELWRSDGTEAGTELVADSNPGPGGQADINEQRIAGTSDGTVYFFASNGSNFGLYKSDDTPGNVTLVKGSQRLFSNMVAAGNRAYFAGGLEQMWTSDGTAAGTVAIGNGNAEVSDPMNVNGTIFYVQGNSVVSVTGTTVTPITGSFRTPLDLTDVNGSIYFKATDATSGLSQIWKLPAGSPTPVLVKSGITFFFGTDVAGTFYFTAPSSSGYTLYKSDGTPTGTVAIKLVSPAGSLDPGYSLTDVGSRLVFINTDAIAGTELWASDGTAAGTGLLKDIYPGTNPSNPVLLPTPVGNRVLFEANDGVAGTQLWSSDGTAAGTYPLTQITSLPGSWPDSAAVIGGRAYFAGTGLKLWVSDGTPAGTYQVADVGPVGGFIEYNGWIYFGADDGVHGVELWRTTGGPGSAEMVADINPGPSPSGPDGFTLMNGLLYFVASSGIGTQLWRTDGTAAGTQQVTDISSGTLGLDIGSLTNLNGTLYFDAINAGGSNQPWISDGTAAGTRMLKDISDVGSNFYSFVAYNGSVYFSTDEHGLWKTNGTADGTVQVSNPFFEGAGPSTFIVLNGRLFFTAHDGIDRNLLWTTSGTAATTEPFNPNLIVESVASIDGRLMMVAAGDGGAGLELWASDGTTAGTSLVQDLYPGPEQGASGVPVDVNGSIFISGNDGISGLELYRFADTFAPFVWNSQFVADPLGSESVSFNFNEPITGLSAANLSIVNVATNSVKLLGSVMFSYDGASNVATFSFAALPAGSYRATLAEAGVADAAGNALPTDATMDFAISALAGSVFDDENNNGLRDPGEPGLAGRTVYLDTNNNGILDSGEISTTADSAGSYVFPDVSPGTATVREVLPAGWARTAPLAASLTMPVAPGASVTGPTFGDVQISTVPMDFSYLLTLAQHYGQQGTFATGDLNDDDQVNFNDLLILAQNYGRSLPAAGAGPAAASDAILSAAVRKLRRRGF